MQTTSLDPENVIGQQGSSRKALVHDSNTANANSNTANASTLPYTIPDADRPMQTTSLDPATVIGQQIRMNLRTKLCKSMN
jgi:hypothetical protein